MPKKSTNDKTPHVWASLRISLGLIFLWAFFDKLLGKGVKIATVSGSLLMFLMWTAVLLPANNPVLDDHLVYILVLAGIYAANGSQKWGLRGSWLKQPLVKKYPFLE